MYLGRHLGSQGNVHEIVLGRLLAIPRSSQASPAMAASSSTLPHPESTWTNGNQGRGERNCNEPSGDEDLTPQSMLPRALRSAAWRTRQGRASGKRMASVVSRAKWDMEHAFADGGFLERREDLRTDPEAMRMALAEPTSRWLLSNPRFHFLLQEVGDTPGSTKKLGAVWLPKDTAAKAMCADDEASMDGTSSFLGIHNGVHYFTVASTAGSIDAMAKDTLDSHAGAGFYDLRKAVSQLSPAEATVLGYARSLLAWQSDNNFCSKCGQALKLLDQGHRKFCESCRKTRYPVIMPCVIMLVCSPDRELCLLGRKSSWKEGVFSCLAGFMEVGETAPNAAAREVLEEAFVECDLESMELVSTQPWPFDANLMIGCQITAKENPGARDQPVNHEEGLAEGRWFTKSEAQAMLARSVDAAYLGAMPNEGRIDGPDEMRVPGPHAIAHTLIKRWVESP